MKTPLIHLPIKTVEGDFVAAYSENGLAELNFPKAGRSFSKTGQPQTVPAKMRVWHRLAVTALKAVLAGKPAKKLPPLDWTGKTQFQQAVWRGMLEIPPGKTKSYGEIAAQIGRPKAVRAVGGACGANPIPVLVPCHRILAANKKLGGFSGGVGTKRRLLAKEGVLV